MKLAAIAIACAACNGAHAQPATDPEAPLACFEIASTKGLTDDGALALCAGALSVAPGQCYAEAADRFHALSTPKLVRLCSDAGTIEPVACYARLDAIGTLTEDQMVAYCATTCPIGPPPTVVADPRCLERALDQSALPLQTATQLCEAARSDGPARCFSRGDRLGLPDTKLVRLCRETIPCQNEVPAPP